MTSDLDNDLLVLIHDVARHMRTYSDQQAQKFGLTRAQMLILAHLQRKGDMTQNELAAVTEVTPMTIARLIDKLQELGLVKRCADPGDRRIWRLRLTPAAAPYLSKIKHLRSKLLDIATEGIAPSTLEAMIVGLHRVKENISSREPVETSA